MFTIAHVTDLHLDHFPDNLAAAVTLLGSDPVDLCLVGGDNGDDAGIAATVRSLLTVHPDARVGWVMGNHDLWHKPYTHLWREVPDVAATYLEMGNLDLDSCTVVGTYGHYDYSGGTAALSHETYENYTDGRVVWNDRFIDHAGRTNPDIAREIADRFRSRYRAAVARGRPIVLLTHTWPFAPTDARLRSFTSAYVSNQLIGDILLASETRPAVAFCGHTHQPARWDEFGFPMINTGSDYREVRVTRWSF